jgi:hypothetical protein
MPTGDGMSRPVKGVVLVDGQLAQHIGHGHLTSGTAPIGVGA